jgi:short-subunit dehydrogenase
MARPLNQQIVVITGASTGIGRLAAFEFARRGASVVLAARNEDALLEAVREIHAMGGSALHVVTDVTKWEDVERLAKEAFDHYGRIDTWVNDAASSVYAYFEEMTIEEIDQQLRSILTSQIYGAKAVLPYLKRQHEGTIINVSSITGIRAVPLLSVYSAAKHGINGFTEALRLELKHQKTGINVTLIMPSSINTPFFNHARSKMGLQPKPIPPVYEPELVADAIVFAAEHPRRDIIIGEAGKFYSIMQKISPTLVDFYMLQNGRMFKQQKAQIPDDGVDNLFEPMQGSDTIKGDYSKQATSISPYTRHLEFHPNRKRVLWAAMLTGMVALIGRLARS